MKRRYWVLVVAGVLLVAAANQMYQLDVYEWLRLRDGVLLSFGTDSDYYARYDAAGNDVELRTGAGVEVVSANATTVSVAGDLDVAGQIEAGTDNHTLTTAEGLINGAKIAAGTITGEQIATAGALPGYVSLIDATNALTFAPLSGHGTLAGDGELTIVEYTGATAEADGVEGLVPAGARGSADRFLCVDGTFKTPSIGAVTGPGSSTDRAVAIWDGVNGDTVQNSTVLVSTSGGLTIPGTVTVGSGAHVWSNTAGLLDGGKLQDATVSSAKLAASGVTAGTYTIAAVTVDSKGRVTAAADGSLGLIDLDDGATAYTAAGFPLVVNATADGWEFAAELDPDVLPVLVGDAGTGGVQGVVPAPAAGDAAAGKYLNADGTWTVPAGAGNVGGPGTSTNNALARFDGTGGQTLADTSITSADGASLVIPGTIALGSGAHVLTNSVGLLDGGKLQAGSVGDSQAADDLTIGAAGSVDARAIVITAAVDETTADDADTVLIYDASATAIREMTRANFLAGLLRPADVDTEAELETLLTDVTDVFTSNDAAYAFLIDSAGTSGYVWTSDGDGKGAWAAATGGAAAFTDLTDVPSAYVGEAGKYVRVNSTEDALEFAVGGGGGAGVFTDLTDVPSAYTGGAGKVVKVNSTEDALEFAADAVGAEAFTDLSDAPSAYTGQAEKYVRVNSTADGLEFVTGTGASGVASFVELNDVPSAYTDQGGKYVRVNSTADGLEFATVSGAVADTLCVLRPRDSFPPGSNYATLDTRNDTPVLDFDAAADEAALWVDVLPIRYGGGGVTVEIDYAMTSATANAVVWAVQWEKIAAETQDLDSDGFATAKTVTSTVSGTCGKVKRASITFSDGTQMDSVGAGHSFRLKVYRDADNAADDATGDAELVVVHIKETSS